MAAKRKKFTGIPSGRSHTKIVLKKGMPAEFANTQLLLVQDTPAIAWYEFDVGSKGSADEPPSVPTFEAVSIRTKATSVWVDDKSSFYCRMFKNTEVVNIFSEATLQDLDERVKVAVQKEAHYSFNMPEGNK